MDNILTELLSLENETAEALLFTLYMHSQDNAVKFWFAAGFSVAKMRRLMLFHTVYLGYISTPYFLEIYRSKFPGLAHDIAILPEYHRGKQDDNILKAIRITRSTPMFYHKQIMDSSFELDVPCWIRPAIDIFMSNEAMKIPTNQTIQPQSLLLPAAIIQDDVAAVKAMSAQPNFTYEPRYLSWAALFASLKCFKFLSLNGCEISDGTFGYACESGNEEIIHLCLEQKVTPMNLAFNWAIRGQHASVAKWLSDIHGVRSGLYYFWEVFRYGCMAPTVDYLISGFLETLCDPYTNRISLRDVINNMLYSRIWKVNHAKFFEMILSNDKCPESIAQKMRQNRDSVMYFDSIEVLKLIGLDDISCDDIKNAVMQNSKHLIAHFADKKMLDATGHNGKTAMMFFVQESSSLKYVQQLVDNGANVNACDSKGKTVLMYAASSNVGDSAVLQFLVDHGADVNAVDACGQNAFMHSASSYSPQIAEQFFIFHNFDVNVSDKLGRTALMIYAMKQPQYHFIVLLVGYGANTTAIDSDGNNVIHHLFQNKFFNSDVLKYLIERGANPLLANAAGVTPLMLAFSNTAFEAKSLNFLLKSGASLFTVDSQGRALEHYLARNPDRDQFISCLADQKSLDLNVSDLNGVTPLMLAVRCQDNERAVKSLIDNGADVNAVDNTGMTALMHAATIAPHGGRTSVISSKVITLLFDNLSHTDVVDASGKNAMVHAAITPGNMDTISYLSDNGMSVNWADALGKSVLMYAVEIPGNSTNVLHLIKSGADPSQHDKEGRTALIYYINVLPVEDHQITDEEVEICQALIHEQSFAALIYAVTRDSFGGAALLLKVNADINATDSNGMSVLMNAAQHSSLEMVQYLVKRNANALALDFSGKTALMHATAGNRETPIIEYLIQCEIDVNAKDKEGKTALFYALMSQNQQVVDCLLSHGASINESCQPERSQLAIAIAEASKANAVLLAFVNNGASSTKATESQINEMIRNLEKVAQQL